MQVYHISLRTFIHLFMDLISLDIHITFLWLSSWQRQRRLGGRSGTTNSVSSGAESIPKMPQISPESNGPMAHWKRITIGSPRNSRNYTYLYIVTYCYMSGSSKHLKALSISTLVCPIPLFFLMFGTNMIHGSNMIKSRQYPTSTYEWPWSSFAL
jgi:hypothetical protein